MPQAVAPQILHIATHGFFLEDRAAGTDRQGTEHPFYRASFIQSGKWTALDPASLQKAPTPHVNTDSSTSNPPARKHPL